MQNTHFSQGYHPSTEEEYMNSKHIEYFRDKLLSRKEKILKESQSAIKALKEEKSSGPDLIDRASDELEAASVSLIQRRQYNIITTIDRALKRIRENSYGYCEDTGEEIGLGRLEARPEATLCVSAQERHEKHKTF
jgi:DnaK suppressor protein